MTRRAEDEPLSLISDQAAEWVGRLSRDDVGEADWLELQAWLGDNEERRTAFDAAQALWLELDQHQAALAAGVSQTSAVLSRPAHPWSGVRSRPAVWIGCAVAAAAAIFAAVLLPLSRTPMPTKAVAPLPATYATAAGQRLTVRLSDGTRIDLDGASRLAVLYSKTARTVSMGQANAAFDVAKDVRRPFLISVGDSTVKVVGTAFDIVRAADETRVTVSRGVVQFDLPSDARRPVRLTPGLSALHHDGTPSLRIAQVAAADATAWRQGRLIYKDAPLSRLVADLNREYRRPIRIGDPNIGDLRFTGVLLIGLQADVVRRLTTLLPLRSEVSHEAIVLRSMRP